MTTKVNESVDSGATRAGLSPRWYLFNGQSDHTYTHSGEAGVVKLWLWGGLDRPASPDDPGGGPGTMYRVQMRRGDRLRIRVGGRPTKSGGGSTDGDWEDWLLGRMIRGGYPDGGEGVEQSLTVRWGYAYPDTGPVWTRSIFWRCNGAGGATRVWLTPLGSEERLIIVEPGAGASPHPRYNDGAGSPMDAYPTGAWGVGDFPFDRQVWSPPSPFDEDQSLAWPPEDSGQALPHFRYSYGWCGNVGGGGPFDEFPDPDPPEAWFGWEQDMTTYRTGGLAGASLEQTAWPVSDLGTGNWTDDTPGGDNFHDDVGPGDPDPSPPSAGDEPRVPRGEVPAKMFPWDTSPPFNEQRETRFGEAGWEERGGNGEPSAFGPRCPGGGGWGGGAAGNTTRRQVVSGDWVSWVRMGQGTGKTGGRWWNTSVVETVIRGDGTVLWGTAGAWLYLTLPYWAPSYSSSSIGPPAGYDFCWPESEAWVYEIPYGDEWGSWDLVDASRRGPYPYFNDPDYDGYLGMGAAWVCPEDPVRARRARWRVGRLGFGRTVGW